MKTYSDFNIQDNGSSALTLVGGNGTFNALDLPRTDERSYFTVSFFDSAALDNRVAATAGTVAILAATDTQLIWKTIADGAFNAVDAYGEDISIPAASGPIANVQVRFAGIAGATHARVYVSKY